MTKILIPVSLVFALASAVLLTSGILASNSVLYVAAVWTSVLFLVSGGAALLGVYKKLTKRLSLANERLVELRFLLERRYELSRERLDTLLDASIHLRDNSDSFPSERGTTRNATARAEFDNVISRLQRLERRIIGRFENELLSNHRQTQQIDELLHALGNSKDLPRE